ncbi:Tyrosine-protein phosphatase Lar-like [Toxocara canis]|uniref:Tyrosine-protein phosphatase Lar-like n=1 Tax=Toxocara canis TaxID=6265 RepID=A0A0B2UWJ7_TOXCA|nr:Tyrosine-protein phosphatase Lar-like [Toxocara canis]
MTKIAARRGGGSRRRRHNRKAKVADEDVTVECEDKRVKQRPKTRRRTGRAISQEVAATLADFVKEVKELGLNGMRKEFEELRSYKPKNVEQTVWKANPTKNRYQDVPCLDATRSLSMRSPLKLDLMECVKNLKSYVRTNQKTLNKRYGKRIQQRTDTKTFRAWTQQGLNGMRKEFEELRSYKPKNVEQTVWKANPTKNRYQDVPCLDATRLVLTLNVPPETDYIHANTIKMEGIDKQYIATQGPLEDTISDFWRMVHQESINTIIMLCKTNEDSKPKCCQYWPEVGGENKTYGSMFVMNKKTEHEDRFETYVLEVLPEGCSNSTLVKLIQMTDWPDRGVPQSGFTVLRLLRMIPLGATTIVHCSAGIGRTGTVIAIDTILARLWKSQKVKVAEVVKEMRNQRAMMVQSEAQYVFIYCTILDYIQAKQPGKYREYVQTFHEEVKNAAMV